MEAEAEEAVCLVFVEHEGRAVGANFKPLVSLRFRTTNV